MTAIALRTGLDMVDRLAGGGGAVVTLRTTARCDAAVIEHGARPAVGRVAVVTGVAGGDMVGRLAGGGGAVVAGRTGADDIGVIDAGDRRPGGVAVTVLAEVARLDVLGVLAGGGGAVVTAGATADDITVIEERPRPAVGGVAIVTGVAGSYMVGRLTGGGDAIVAAGTRPGDLAMVKARVLPAARGVAVIAAITALHVRWRFPGGDPAVVAGRTGAHGIAVIKTCYLCPGIRRMTGFAVVSGRHMASRFAFATEPGSTPMTYPAACWRAFENTARVAGVAIGALVPAGEGESGGKMVEIAGGVAWCRRCEEQAENQHQRDNSLFNVVSAHRGSSLWYGNAHSRNRNGPGVYRPVCGRCCTVLID